MLSIAFVCSFLLFSYAYYPLLVWLVLPGPSIGRPNPTDFPIWSSAEDDDKELLKAPTEGISRKSTRISFFRFLYPRTTDRYLAALAEYGDELRNFMLLGRDFLLPPSSRDKHGDAHRELLSSERGQHFRRRLHQLAPWIRGFNPDDPHWPFSIFPEPIPDGKAIVICAGNRQLDYLKALLHQIRTVHHSSIPVRIVYRDKHDLTAGGQQELVMMLGSVGLHNLHFMDLSTYYDLDLAEVSGWNLKAFGLIATPEQQVMLLDSDVLLFQPPEFFFDMDRYVDKGAFFFHDRALPEVTWTPRSFVGTLQPHLSINGLKNLKYGRWFAEHIMEAGVVLLDKRRQALGLWTAVLIFGRKDIIEFAQRDHMYGDKEIFWMSFETVQEPYNMARYYPGVVGNVFTDFGFVRRARQLGETFDRDDLHMSLCGPLLHLDDNGVPLWSNGGYLTRQDDLPTSFEISDGPMEPFFYVDGGDSFTEHIPVAQHAYLGFGDNQHWRISKSLGVMCLYPNARRIQVVAEQIQGGVKKSIDFYVKTN